MRVLIAPDSFKGSLTALDAAKCMNNGVLRVFPDAECDLAPMADGGEGTVDAMVEATAGTLHYVDVRGPLGASVRAAYGLLGDGGTAVVEMASSSGLPLIRREERDPLHACTYGTGEVIRYALRALHDSKANSLTKPRIIIGIGGSATNDGGAGCLRALGAKFLDSTGREIAHGGAALADLDRIDLSGLDPLLAQTDILVACDVDNPLCGPRGASAVFGPQKGATPAMVEQLDKALAHYADIAGATTGRNQADHPGAGAAGGLGAGLLFFTGSRLLPGVQIVVDALNLAERAQKANAVLTGEGHSDFQTVFGKAPVGVAKVAKSYGKPVICISGGLGQGHSDIFQHGVDALAASICSVMPLEECMERAAIMLEDATERVLRLLRLGMQLR